MSNTNISKRILETMLQQKISYGELSKMTNIPKSALQRYATGQTDKIPIDRLETIAKALKVSSAWLIGWSDEEPVASVNDISIPSNIIPMPEMRKIPLLGAIACGEPIIAEENIEGEIDIPAEIKADFALTCKGDSMINARIFDGDIVYLRQQNTVENGEIAAVLIDGEATLKRVKLYNDHISLEPENPQYRPLVFWGEEMNNVRIIGKALAFTSAIK